MMVDRPLKIAIAAGGTGGHMMPAHVLAQELRRRGHDVWLVTDRRGSTVPGLFRDCRKFIVESGHMTGSLAKKALALRYMLKNVGQIKDKLQTERPQLLIGFGGYVTLPALLAARRLKIPTCLHEQNAVLGRVNRLFARRATALAVSFPKTGKMPHFMKTRVEYTGNPVRKEIARLSKEAYPPVDDEHILRLLIIGGSQGARVLSDVVPDALSMLPTHLKRRLQVTQQCRPEDEERVRAKYRQSEIAAELATYLEDIPDRLMWTHLVIARAGASTLAELTASGRPAILVPLTIAADDHQSANARYISEPGGSWFFSEQDFTPQLLAKTIQKLALDPKRLRDAAEQARALGRPDAARRLADLIEEIAMAAVLNKSDWVSMPEEDGDAETYAIHPEFPA